MDLLESGGRGAAAAHPFARTPIRVGYGQKHEQYALAYTFMSVNTTD